MSRTRWMATWAVITAGSVALGHEWTSWRGPLQCGLSPDKAPVTSWTHDGQNQLWKAPVGGRTTPIVMNQRVYLITPTGEGIGLRERVVCLDANTGKPVWEHAFNVFHTDIVENRVGWTALAGDPETGNVYAHATGGEFFCFDRDGKILWKHSLSEEYGRFTGYGGRIYTPVVDQDLVIISFLNQGWGADQAAMGHRFVAFDKRTGQVRWWASPAERPLDTTYATPVVATIDGRRLLICPAADGWVYALLATSGDTVWKYRLAGRPINISPVADGKLIYVGHSEENYDTTVMGRIACIDGSGSGDITKTGEVWRADGIDAGYATPALANGRLYIVDNSANLICLDAKTGKTNWSHSLGRIGRGSPIATSDGVIYVGEQNGVFYIVKDDGDKCTVLDREEFPDTHGAITEIQGSPSIADGRVYFQTRYALYCLGSAAPVAAAAPAAAESAKFATTRPALRVMPADVTLAPGDSLKLGWVTSAGPEGAPPAGTPKFELAGVSGTISPEGVFTAASDNVFSAGVIKASLGGLTTGARVRISPKLPFEEDFEHYAADANPPGWINVIQKTKVVERDGSKVLKTLSERPSPAFMRLRTYMTPPIAGGYTISADMLGTPKPPRWKPDMGVVNSRYELLLLGNESLLRMVTWPPIPRLQKDVPFELKTDAWYRMKFQVKLEGGKALLRGKVWLRDEPEPAAWTIEAEDPYPNAEGSPALYAYAAGTTEKKKGTEVYFDNVKVMPNE